METKPIDPNKKMIAIADDSEEFVALYKAILSEQYEIFASTDPYDLLEYSSNHQTDLLIIDLMMPQIHGLELIHLIRRTQHMPIVVVSGSSDPNEIESAKKQADRFLQKPFEPEELLKIISGVLSESSNTTPWKLIDTSYHNRVQKYIHRPDKTSDN